MQANADRTKGLPKSYPEAACLVDASARTLHACPAIKQLTQRRIPRSDPCQTNSLSSTVTDCNCNIRATVTVAAGNTLATRARKTTQKATLD